MLLPYFKTDRLGLADLSIYNLESCSSVRLEHHTDNVGVGSSSLPGTTSSLPFVVGNGSLTGWKERHTKVTIETNSREKSEDTHVSPGRCPCGLRRDGRGTRQVP